MSDMNLSLLGIHNFLTAQNEPSFMDAQYFALPSDFTADDRSAVTALILSESAELECVYPEPSTLCTVIKAWSHARLPSWTRMYDALTAEYNPLHNYDRYEIETGTDTGTRTQTHTGTRGETEAEDIADTASDTATGQVTGFNSSSFTDDKKTVSSGTGSRDRDVTRSETRNLSDGETRNLANSRDLHAYGNIGVTTAVQMLNEELELRKTDIFRIITNEFIEYFCLSIY